MFKNYIKIAIRNLRRHKGYTLINLAGLAVGMACGALILLYIRHELSYDRFHQKAARVYRLTSAFEQGGMGNPSSVIAAAVGPALVEDYPEITNAVRLQPPYNTTLVQYQEKQFYEAGVYLADPSLFDIFNFPLQQGDAKTALLNSSSVVLSSEAAHKYFGEENPIGKILRIERGKGEFHVTGILQPIPTASHLRPNFIIPFSILEQQGQLENWGNFSFPTYVLLRENTPVATVESKLPDFVKRHYASISPGTSLHLDMQPLADVHLHSDFDNPAGKLSAMTYIYFFAALAFLIIAVACFNFMNLATARSQPRAREVGVRKVVGSRRMQLICQFLVESFVLSFAAIIGAVVLIEFFLPAFNGLAQKELRLQYSSDGMLVAGFIALAIIVGLAAGSYPAFFLSRFQPVEVLKGGSRTGAFGARLRQALVIGQFAISILLMACTLVVNDQIEFVHHKRLGFDKEQVVVVPLRGEHQNDWPVLKTELLRHPEISHVTASSAVPADANFWVTISRRGDAEGAKDIYTYQIDYDFFATLGMELAAGRSLSREFPSDSAQAFVLNETAVKRFGWESAQAAIGQPFVWLAFGGMEKKGMVVGVVKDFHFRPLYEEIAPAVFHLMPWGKSFLLVRVRSNRMEQALNILKTQWRTLDPTRPLEFSFMDAKVETQYGAETRLLKIFSIFSGFAIFISCLGLFGLISFTAEQRTKEIGIRKVLGATVSSIVFMLSNSFTKLVVIAFVVATPLAWWAMYAWLQNFAYRAHLGWSKFALAGGGALLIALLTVSTQALKVAFANPVEALRYE